MIVSFVPVFSFVGTSGLTTTGSPANQQLQVAPAPANKRRNKRRMLWSTLLFLAAFSGLVAHYNVDKTLTDEDRYYIRLLLPGVEEGIAAHLPYEGQIELLQRSQQAIAARVSTFEPIPEGQPREPKQLYLGRKGQCYDRSRGLEKIFTYLGLPSRHVSLFMREPGVKGIVSVLFHHIPSHAISEVLTAKGWMLVDSNDPWLGLDELHNPISVHQMVSSYETKRPLHWLTPKMGAPNSFYGGSCIYIYGLYSRHGRFFPPYTSYIPDYRVRGLLYNFSARN
jgi:hypothetical protein